MAASDKPSYWLTKAANALDCAVQLTGDDEIDRMESRCDALAASYAKRDGRVVVTIRGDTKAFEAALMRASAIQRRRFGWR